ncbi:Hypothetical protein ORPV_612 [Orpheovirus IHUMI-LCC2]|uniref:Uncharacterized protein n=1 Tax=Orpheovirus IHUMI-LCC2 TaxID=2023057 RepID=A0A2I2L4R5_9VIRU|nr:Hypothetical protein ORPV_612 [Orpheovirus IHUMI-LCC2]SNW62516.1 Hypothetical protein ORPV_612 [Orpheovirus IHUMI-LCC2]
MNVVYNKFVSLGLHDSFMELLHMIKSDIDFNNIDSIWDYVLNYYNLLQLENEYKFLANNVNNKLSYDCGVSHPIENESTWKAYILHKVSTLLKSDHRTIMIAEKKVEYISSKYRRRMKKIGRNINYRTRASEYSTFRRFCHLVCTALNIYSYKVNEIDEYQNNKTVFYISKDKYDKSKISLTSLGKVRRVRDERLCHIKKISYLDNKHLELTKVFL